MLEDIEAKLHHGCEMHSTADYHWVSWTMSELAKNQLVLLKDGY